MWPQCLRFSRRRTGNHAYMATDDFVSVHEAPNPTEHLLLRSLLEGHGIEVRLEGTSPTGTYPDSAGSMAQSSLYVSAKDADKARQLLRDAEAGKLDLGSAAPSAGGPS